MLRTRLRFKHSRMGLDQIRNEKNQKGRKEKYTNDLNEDFGEDPPKPFL
jgi:hypothetical protein